LEQGRRRTGERLVRLLLLKKEQLLLLLEEGVGRDLAVEGLGRRRPWRGHGGDGSSGATVATQAMGRRE
jgi:hypothetical protein